MILTPCHHGSRGKPLTGVAVQATRRLMATSLKQYERVYITSPEATDDQLAELTTLVE